MRLLLNLSIVILPLMAAGAYGKDAGRSALKTKECVKHDGAGVCREWDTTFSMAGASCTENCILFDAMDSCKVRNSCKYDSASGCYKKKVCLHTNALDDCDSWKSEPACH